MADLFDVQCALQDAKGRVFTGLNRRVHPGKRDALVFSFEGGSGIEVPGSTPDYLIMAAAVFETDVRIGGVRVRESLAGVTDVLLTAPTGETVARVRFMKPPSHMADDRDDLSCRLEGRKIEAVRLSDKGNTAVYWNESERLYESVSFEADSVRVYTRRLPATVTAVRFTVAGDMCAFDADGAVVFSGERVRRAADRTADGQILRDTGDMEW